MSLPPGLRLEADLRLGDMVGHILLWFVVILVTFGFAAFLFPYSLSRQVLERTYVLDAQGRRIARLEAPSDLGADIVHAIIWWLLSVVTCGIAGLFYAYKVPENVLARTRLVPLG